MSEDLEILKQALIGADRDTALGAVERLVDAGVDPKVILEEGMAVAMFDLGEMWKRGEVFLPEVVASAAVFKQCNEIVEPVLLAQRQPGDQQAAIVILCIYVGVAISAKRLHDRDKSAWWLLLYYLVPGVLNGLAQDSYEGMNLVLNLIGHGISLWALIDLGFLRGTPGDNQYGSDPLAKV